MLHAPANLYWGVDCYGVQCYDWPLGKGIRVSIRWVYRVWVQGRPETGLGQEQLSLRTSASQEGNCSTFWPRFLNTPIIVLRARNISKFETSAQLSRKPCREKPNLKLDDILYLQVELVFSMTLVRKMRPMEETAAQEWRNRLSQSPRRAF